MADVPYVEYVLSRQKHTQLQAHDQLADEGTLAALKQGHLEAAH